MRRFSLLVGLLVLGLLSACTQPSPPNVPPGISAIADLELPQASTPETVTVSFTVSDTEDALADLGVTASAEGSAVTVTGVTCELAACSVTLEVVRQLESLNTVTVTVTDSGGKEMSTRFEVRVVNAPPVLSSVEDISLFRQTTIGSETVTVSFTVSDTNDAVEALELSASSDGSAVTVAQPSCAAAVCSVALTIARQAVSETLVTIQAKDTGGRTASTSFTVRVINVPPTISSIENATFFLNTTAPAETLTVTFQIDDTEEANGALTVSATADRDAVLPASPSCNAAGSCTLTLQVDISSEGETVVTVTVRDNEGGESATDFTVTVQTNRIALTGSGDEVRLRNAMVAAQAGAVLELDASAVTTPFTLAINDEFLVTKALELRGPGQADLILDAQGNGRHFRIASGTPFTLSDLTLTNGAAQNDGGQGAGEPLGGAIINSGTLTVKDVLFTKNDATRGGGIFHYGSGSLTVQNCSFGGSASLANNAARSGGSIFNDDSTATVINSQFIANTATERTAGIYNLGTSAALMVQDSTFRENNSWDGTAIKNELGAVVIRNSIIDNNTATQVEGGGIFNLNGSIEIYDSELTNNEAVTGYGGALYTIGGNASVLLDNTRIEGNRAVNGAGIASESNSPAGGTLVLRGTTAIKANFARNSGGGVFNAAGSTLTLQGAATISSNQSDSNSDSIGEGGGIYNEGTLVGVTSSNVFNNMGGDVVNGP